MLAILPMRSLIRTSGGPRLLAAAMLDAAGTGVILPLSVLYFVIDVGLSARSVGVGMTVAGIVALLAAPLGGHFVDHAGPKRALISAWIAAAFAAAGFAVVQDWFEMVVVIAALSVATSVSGTSRATLLASFVSRAEISGVMAVQRTFRNIGYGIGGLLATAALAAGSTGFLVAICCNAASFLVAALLVLGVKAPAVTRSREPASKSPESDPRQITLRTVFTDKRYVAVSLLDCLTTFHQVALQVAMPLWVVLYTDAPRALVGLLFTLNTALVVAGQVRVSRGVRTLDHAPRAYVRCALSMAGAGGAFLAAHYVGAVAAIALLVAGTVLMTCAEMFAEAADWVVSFALADDDHRGKYLSVYSMGGSLGTAVGPTVSTTLMAAGAIVTWPAIAAIVVCGALPAGAIAASAVRGARETEPAYS